MTGADQQNHIVKHQTTVTLIQGNCVLMLNDLDLVLSLSAPCLNLCGCGHVIRAF